MTKKPRSYDQVVYLLQGGGALGAYQAGVCEALLEHGSNPDWIVGTSIGAINGAIIAGNAPQDRIAKLHEFWDKISLPLPSFTGVEDNVFLQESLNFFYSQWATIYGQPNFFSPRLINPLLFIANTPDKISFYDTSELKETLKNVINFDLLNKCHIRLTLGAVRIKGGKAARFDNTHQVIGPEHIMASSALPPGFPAIKIDGEYYWDGGLSSNTPFSVVIEEKTPQKLLCFIVNLFSFPESLPTSLWDVLKYKKEIEFASRHQEVLRYFCEVHELQHAINILAKTSAHSDDLDSALKRIQQMGHPTSLNIIRFHYRDRRTDLWSKDFNFWVGAIREHWQIGYRDVKKALQNSSWLDVIEDDSGAVMHEI